MKPVQSVQTERSALETAPVQPMAQAKAALADPSQLLTGLETAGPANWLV